MRLTLSNFTQIGLLITLTITFVQIHLVSSKTGPSHDKVVVCYISTWAVYRTTRGSYSLDNVDPNLCTHMVYAFSGLDIENDAIKSLDPWQDLKDDYGKGGYEKITSMKNLYPHLKVNLAIGGWNEGSANYSLMASDAERRKRFVKNASEFVRKYKFDGLDLDWEYPALRGGIPSDKQNFVKLVKELKAEFGQYNLMVTSAIGAAKDTIDKAYDIVQLTKYLDFLHIMCYDYGGSWDKKVAPNAPLANYGILNVQFTIEYLIQLGADPSKIVLGIPFYGRTFVTYQEGNYGDQTDEIGFKGPYTNENGFLGYNELCEVLTNRTSGWTTKHDMATNQGMAKYRDSITGITKVVTYDSARVIANKMRYAMNKKLAGAMVWSIDTDDFQNDCADDSDTFTDFHNNVPAGVKLNLPLRINNNYPLLRTINEGIIISLDIMRQEEEIKESEIDNEIPHGHDDNNNKSNIVHRNPAIIIVTIIFSIILSCVL